MKRLLGIVLLFTAFTLVSCSDDDGNDGGGTASGATFPMTIKGTDGQSITLNAAPNRIISLGSDGTEILCSLGAANQIVAVDRFENCPSGSSAKPALDSFEPDLEAIAKYQPDLVYTSYAPPGFIDALKKLRVPVLYLDEPADIAGIYERIKLFGDITGRREDANAVVEKLKVREVAVIKKVGSGPGPRVFHELDDTFYTVAPGSFIGDVYKQLKATNIAEGAPSDFPQLSTEVIIQKNPQVIVLADADYGTTATSVKQRPGWNLIDAVKNDRICPIDADIVSRAGPRIIDAMEALGKCLYPERF